MVSMIQPTLFLIERNHDAVFLHVVTSGHPTSSTGNGKLVRCWAFGTEADTANGPELGVGNKTDCL